MALFRRRQKAGAQTKTLSMQPGWRGPKKVVNRVTVRTRLLRHARRQCKSRSRTRSRLDEPLEHLAAPVDPGANRSDAGAHYAGNLLIAETLHVAQEDGAAEVSRKTAERTFQL